MKSNALTTALVICSLALCCQPALAKARGGKKAAPAGPKAKIISFSFEKSDLQGWAAKKNSVSFSDVYNSQAYAFGGLHSLAFPVDLDKKAANGELQGEAVVYFSAKPLNFRKIGRVTLQVRVVGGTWAQNWLWVQPYFFRYSADGDKWDYITEKGEGIFPKDKWKRIVWNVKTVKPRDKIGEFGFWISGGQDAQGRATVYVDDVHFIPVAMEDQDKSENAANQEEVDPQGLSAE